MAESAVTVCRKPVAPGHGTYNSQTRLAGDLKSERIVTTTLPVPALRSSLLSLGTIVAPVSVASPVALMIAKALPKRRQCLRFLVARTLLTDAHQRS